MNVFKVLRIIKAMQAIQQEKIWDFLLYSDGSWSVSDDLDQIVIDGNNIDEFAEKVIEWMRDELFKT